MTASLSLILIIMSNFVSSTNVISNDFTFVSRSHKKKNIKINSLGPKTRPLKGNATLRRWLKWLIYSRCETMCV